MPTQETSFTTIYIQLALKLNALLGQRQFKGRTINDFGGGAQAKAGKKPNGYSRRKKKLNSTTRKKSLTASCREKKTQHEFSARAHPPDC